MAPTEYRAIAKRTALRPLPSLRHAVAAGEPLNPEIVRAAGSDRGRRVDPRRLRPDRDRRADRDAARRAGAARLDGPAAAGVRACWIEDGELCVDPTTVPTFFIDAPPTAPWRTGDRVREDDDGYLWFEGRADDVIISAGYRIGPFEVESALVSHPAVAEAAAVAAPDEERGQVVRAVVVLRDGVAASRRARARAAGARQGARRRRTSTRASSTSPTRCRRRASGKIKRAELRG